MQKDFNSLIIDKLFDMVVAALVFSLFVIPFLIISSYFPVSKFYSEISAMFLAVLLGVVLICRSKTINISPVAIACFVFAVFLLVQVFFVRIRFPGVNISMAIEFIFLGVFSIGISSSIFGSYEIQNKLVNFVVWGALFGATIQALIGFLQYTGIAADWGNYIFYVNSDSVNLFGNIGQRNQFVDFVSIGVFALSYLFFMRKINIWVFSLYGLFFASIMTVAAARTVFVYFFVAIIIGCIFILANRKNFELKADFKRLIWVLLGLFFGLIIVQMVLPIVLPGASSGLERMSHGVDQSTYRRFYEWWKCLVIFTQHPLIGAGWYQYSREGIYIMLTNTFSYIPANRALFTHSHNSLLNSLAETGAIGFFILWIYGFAYSLYRMFKTYNNYQTLFITFMLFCIFLHSNFEYPLWYAYFLVLFVLFLSFSSGKINIKNTLSIKSIFVIIFVGFAWICYNNSVQYDKLVQMSQVPTDADDYKNNVANLEGVINNSLMWSLPALMVLDTYNMPGSATTNSVLSPEEQVKYTDMLANELPYPGALLKQVIIHKLVGDNKGALYYAKLLAHAYPFYKEQFVQQLSGAGTQFADVINELNSFEYEDKSYFAKHFKKDR